MSERILVVISSWPSAEHPYLVYLYKNLKERFPKLRLFLFKRVQERKFAEELVGKKSVDRVLHHSLYRFPVTKNPFKYFLPAVRIIIHPLSSIRVIRSCRKEGETIKSSLVQLLNYSSVLGKKFDLIYINSLQTARHLRLRAIFPDTPILASSRGQDFDWDISGFDTVLRNLSGLHVLGRHLKQLAISRGFAEDRISIIPPAILPLSGHRGNPHVGNGNVFTIITAARLVWTKGYIYCLRAFSIFKERMPAGFKCEYIILGSGPDLEYLQCEIERLGLQESVSIAGWLPQKEVDQYLVSADVYLLLSISEGFNNSVMQAQNSGLPCVVSDAGGLPDNVVHEKTGFVVPRYDAEAAAARLVELATNNELRCEMSTFAKSRMRSEFSLEAQTDLYCKFYLNVMRRD